MMMPRFKLCMSLLALGPLGACSVDATQAAPEADEVPSDTTPAPARPPLAMDSDAYLLQEVLDEDNAPNPPAEAPAAEPLPVAENEDAPAPVTAPLPRAPAPDIDDPSAEPVEIVAAVPTTPLALRATLSATGLTLGVSGHEDDEVPKVSALVLHLAGEGVDRTQRWSPVAEHVIDLASDLPDGAYRYAVSMERELSSGTASASAAVDDNGRNAADPNVQTRSDLPSLPRASGSFQVERGALLPPTVEPRPAATEPRGTP